MIRELMTWLLFTVAGFGDYSEYATPADVPHMVPPAQYRSGPVEYELRPWAFLACGNRLACAQPYASPCIVRIAPQVEDMPAEWRAAIVEHELAHCRGWAGNHPAE